ncbi:MAG: L,D-transpeptidase/peptidoglycan binding protein [Coriobacteriales bacterium]|jgi:lipoprotein-anchoring transpeptidase ErfK/SrfK|nr:L,D-transpeptidase/peptidoglycan binding protein [Coriobacteriales bacterium]
MRHAKTSSRARRAIGLSLLVVLVFLIFVYGGAVVFFQTHYAFNTTIDGTDCSLKQVSYIEKTKSIQMADYELLVRGREDLTATITGADIKLRYVPDGQLDAILAQQNPFFWIVDLLVPSFGHTTTPSLSFDEDKLDATLKGLEFFSEEQVHAPVDAYISYEDNAYVLHPEEQGTTLDSEKTGQLIREAIAAEESELDLEVADCYLEPEILSGDETLSTRVNLWNTYVPFQITYVIDDKTEVLDASVAIDWVDYRADGSGYVNEDKLTAWVMDFDARYSTVGVKRSFTTADGQPAEVEGGYYGWDLDEDAEVDAIKAAINGHYAETREPIFVQRAASHEPADWGETYLEVNITTQHMYYVVDGAIVFESDVVTGLPDGYDDTDVGVFWILEKKSPTVLLGTLMPDGKREYESPVSYWMRITWKGIGFHDATWQPVFGGDWYLNHGSHGCINMPFDKAKELYGLVEYETPVIVHF